MIKLYNSQEIIGNAKERFDTLRKNPHHNLTKKDWHAWYSGWIEGRFQMLGDEFLLMRAAAKERNGCVAETCAGCKHISVWKGCDWDGE